MASSMSLSRSRSGRIDNPGRRQDFLTEYRPEPAFRNEVDWAAKATYKVCFQPSELDEPNLCIGLELDQQIDVAARIEIISQGRSKERQLANAVTSANILQFCQASGTQDKSKRCSIDAAFQTVEVRDWDDRRYRTPASSKHRTFPCVRSSVHQVGEVLPCFGNRISACHTLLPRGVRNVQLTTPACNPARVLQRLVRDPRWRVGNDPADRKSRQWTGRFQVVDVRH